MKYMPDQIYNAEITVQEVTNALNKSKYNRAPGLDSITYDDLKNNISVQVLTRLFNLCFERGMMPTTWTRGLINPIPKSAISNLRVPPELQID